MSILLKQYNTLNVQFKHLKYKKFCYFSVIQTELYKFKELITFFQYIQQQQLLLSKKFQLIIQWGGQMYMIELNSNYFHTYKLFIFMYLLFIENNIKSIKHAKQDIQILKKFCISFTLHKFLFFRQSNIKHNLVRDTIPKQRLPTHKKQDQKEHKKQTLFRCRSQHKFQQLFTTMYLFWNIYCVVQIFRAVFQKYYIQNYQNNINNMHFYEDLQPFFKNVIRQHNFYPKKKILNVLVIQQKQKKYKCFFQLQICHDQFSKLIAILNLHTTYTHTHTYIHTYSTAQSLNAHTTVNQTNVNVCTLRNQKSNIPLYEKQYDVIQVNIITILTQINDIITNVNGCTSISKQYYLV
eukprot:TRINITY_DN4451_c0_g1_i4.p2 TRINITY_DN4451_c0_g1~~TRINITY_DN4451_c0_g1_i4.p2  ORF type:complete len:351 (+),score=-22.31 TRINITY_DN4451_c0_g1_i4:1343-2395(+)